MPPPYIPYHKNITHQLLAAVAAVVVSGASEVVTLDDSNFEHLTQAATGATTGDWFVKFYAPWYVVLY